MEINAWVYGAAVELQMHVHHGLVAHSSSTRLIGSSLRQGKPPTTVMSVLPSRKSASRGTPHAARKYSTLGPSRRGAEGKLLLME